MTVYCQFPSARRGATCPACCYSLPMDFAEIPRAICGSLSTCDGSPPKPTLAGMAKAAISAGARWLAAGSPKRSPEEYERTFAICRACPQFRDEAGGRCGHCGCYLAAKIAMATESCPLNPPRWTADV